MAKSKLRICPEVLDGLIFRGTENPVRIFDANFDYQHGVLILSIEGDDVPDSVEVLAICNCQQNRFGDKHITMTFKAVS
ncbi:MAG: hypothetical protein KGJ57_17455 [Sphingomonadales bacterium]|nr:hypothetical protein [Sphingomonadales bacterium]MDE2171185.1 hypothetical protein [Sphingomonadales bacterium]